MAPSSSVQGLPLQDKQSLIEADLEHFQETHRPPTLDLPRHLQDAVFWLHDHLFDPELTVTQLRERHNLRNNNFSCQFRLAMGRGVREYIEGLRLEAAKGLLRHEDLEIFLIAAAVGYAHQESFSRAFRRRFDCTPTQLRKRLRANVKKRR